MYAARVSLDEIKKGCDARRKHKAACNLSRGLRGESSHKAASEGKSSSVRARLVGGVKVDRTAVDYDYEHTKPATRLDHGHELN